MENCHDGKVVARIAYICDERNGMMDNFENAVAYRLPMCPVIRRARKRPQISSLAEDIQGGLNEDSHDGNVASAKISSGEEASCEKESNQKNCLMTRVLALILNLTTKFHLMMKSHGLLKSC